MNLILNVSIDKERTLAPRMITSYWIHFHVRIVDEITVVTLEKTWDEPLLWRDVWWEACLYCCSDWCVCIGLVYTQLCLGSLLKMFLFIDLLLSNRMTLLPKRPWLLIRCYYHVMNACAMRRWISSLTTKRLYILGIIKVGEARPSIGC